MHGNLADDMLISLLCTMHSDLLVLESGPFRRRRLLRLLRDRAIQLCAGNRSDEADSLNITRCNLRIYFQYSQTEQSSDTKVVHLDLALDMFYIFTLLLAMSLHSQDHVR